MQAELAASLSHAQSLEEEVRSGLGYGFRSLGGFLSRKGPCLVSWDCEARSWTRLHQKEPSPTSVISCPLAYPSASKSADLAGLGRPSVVRKPSCRCPSATCHLVRWTMCTEDAKQHQSSVDSAGASVE